MLDDIWELRFRNLYSDGRAGDWTAWAEVKNPNKELKHISFFSESAGLKTYEVELRRKEQTDDWIASMIPPPQRKTLWPKEG